LCRRGGQAGRELGDPQVVDSLATTNVTAGRFVGREHELALLRQALDDARDGHGRLVMLVGEPGIGKATLAGEFERIARQHGAQVLWGRCWEGDGAPAFWPWVQVIRDYAAGQDPATLRVQMEVVAPDLVRMVPDVARYLPEYPDPALSRKVVGAERSFRNRVGGP